MEKNLVVKITPPDGTWSSAKELANAIIKDCAADKILRNVKAVTVEVNEVYSEAKSTVNYGVVKNFGNVQNAAPNIHIH